jgi:hypothetical protein
MALIPEGADTLPRFSSFSLKAAPFAGAALFYGAPSSHRLRQKSYRAPTIMLRDGPQKLNVEVDPTRDR